MDDELRNIGLIHCEMYDVYDRLKGLESILDVLYKSLIENPNDDVWGRDTDKYICLLSDPYISILDSVRSIMARFDDLHNQMDIAIMDLDKKFPEGRSA